MTLLVGSIFHMTRKIVSEMTYNVSMGTLNPTIPYHTINDMYCRHTHTSTADTHSTVIIKPLHTADCVCMLRKCHKFNMSYTERRVKSSISYVHKSATTQCSMTKYLQQLFQLAFMYNFPLSGVFGNKIFELN